MGIPVREIDKISNKWAAETPLRADEYAAGVKSPKGDWEKGAVAANDTYVRGVTTAAQQGRYKAGVARAGNEKWQNNAMQKGPGRFSEGVMLGKTAYHEGFAPYRDVISKIELPPRGPRGDAANLQRVTVVAKALNEKRLAAQK